MKFSFLIVGITTAIWASTIASPEPVYAAAPPDGSLRISLVSSLFRDIPESLVKVLSRPMLSLMEAQTGLSAQLQPSVDALTLAKQLEAEQTQLAVFHGYEFAWMKAKYSDLKPLVTLLGQETVLHACLVVRGDSKIANPADLKGKGLSIAYGTREPCYMFLSKRCCGGQEADAFYRKVKYRGDPKDTLTDVAEDYTQAALVEKVVIEEYRKTSPDAWKQFRILAESEPFPAGVIAYKSGGVDEATVRRFREGMLTAHETARGKELLGQIRLNRFGPIPEDYDSQLKEIIKAYPAPK